jgi:hypothetical protein
MAGFSIEWVAMPMLDGHYVFGVACERWITTVVGLTNEPLEILQAKADNAKRSAVSMACGVQ